MDRKEQYLAEKSLADRLRNSTQEQRKTLYTQIYKEYFDLFPGEMEKAADPKKELSAIKKFLKPGFSFLEIGAGKGELADAVSKLVAKVTTLDVVAVTSGNVKSDTYKTNHLSPITLPSNVSHLYYDGVSIALPHETFELAYSNQVLEHIHPDDIDAHFTMVRDSLKVGGKYIVITPHRLGGPHDISRGFTQTASGLHLHEWTYRELYDAATHHDLRVRSYYTRAGISIRVPKFKVLLYEKLISLLPFTIRQPLARILWPQVMVVLEKS